MHNGSIIELKCGIAMTNHNHPIQSPEHDLMVEGSSWHQSNSKWEEGRTICLHTADPPHLFLDGEQSVVVPKCLKFTATGTNTK